MIIYYLLKYFITLFSTSTFFMSFSSLEFYLFFIFFLLYFSIYRALNYLFRTNLLNLYISLFQQYFKFFFGCNLKPTKEKAIIGFSHFTWNLFFFSFFSSLLSSLFLGEKKKEKKLKRKKKRVRGWKRKKKRKSLWWKFSYIIAKKRWFLGPWTFLLLRMNVLNWYGKREKSLLSLKWFSAVTNFFFI